MVVDASKDALLPRDVREMENWVFRDREGIERRFGMKLEKVLEHFHTEAGKKELLKKMKAADPSLNGNVDSALNLVNKNIEQLQKKESFLKKMLMLPVRGVQAVGRTMKKHPVLTALAGITALIALLYFTTPLGTTIGGYGLQMIDAFKKVLGKLNIPIPKLGVDAVAKVPVAGGPVDPFMAKEAAEAMQSSGLMQQATHEFLQSAGKAGAQEALKSGAAEAFGAGVEAATEVAPQVIDPLQRALQGLPSLP